jgi:hypothetical protein
MAARDVDSYLTGYGSTQLPVSGGIVKRVPYEVTHKHDEGAAKVAAVAA